MSFLTLLTLLPVLLIAACLDVRDGRIPNELIVMGAGLAGLTHLIENSFAMPPPAILLFILLLLVLRHFHLIGGGDIKLYLLILFLLPVSGGSILICLSFLINALFGLVLLLKERIHRFPMGPGILASAVACHLFL